MNSRVDAAPGTRLSGSVNDRWSLPYGQAYRMLQYSFRVEWDDPRVGELLDDFLGWFRLEGADGLPRYSLMRSSRDGTLRAYLNKRCFHQATNMESLLNSLLRRLNSEAIRRTRAFMLVHSGAASWRSKGILFPAAMESGKSTLVAGLVHAGFSYLSDEAAAIDPVSAWVYPYPKPLALDPSSVELIRSLADKLPPEYGRGTTILYHVRPADLRKRSIGKACRIRFVIAPTYDPGRRTRLDPISRAETLTVLAVNLFNLGRWRSRGIATLGRVAEQAEGYRLSVGNLDEAVHMIGELVRGSAPVVQ
jgi:hypothetical protein